MSLNIYNTLTKKKEQFKSIEEKKVRMYVCGPTVYSYLHIGNFRGAIFFNLLRNWLEHQGYEVTYVYNYTDVDDKIINAAKEEGVDSRVISERYIQEFERDFSRLGLKKHDHNPRVTDYIDSIISYVAGLITNGKAYVVEGEVFYSIESFGPYGRLSGKNIEDLNSGERVAVDARKKSAGDFVLWKPAKEGGPAWDSPWGPGRPGWHIECSAMIKALLGDSIDIHGGGIDLIFPHHENEIAQGEGHNNCVYCNYWMHNEFINLSGEKMSKSLGNVITGRAFMDEYHPEVLKFIMLASHYRSQLDIGDEKIEQAFSGLVRVYRALQVAEDLVCELPAATGGQVDKKFAALLKESDQGIAKAMNDDFSTGEVFAFIYDLVRAFNALNLMRRKQDPSTLATALAFKEWVHRYGEMMALFVLPPAKFLGEVDEILMAKKGIDRAEVEGLIAKRQEARNHKNWALSDQFRDRLQDLGIEFQDTEGGTLWNVKV